MEQQYVSVKWLVSAAEKMTRHIKLSSVKPAIVATLADVWI